MAGRGDRVVSTSDCYAGGFPIESGILPLLKHACGKVTDCHASCQEVSRCCTRSESLEHISCMPLPSVNKAAPSGFETQRRCHQKSKKKVSAVPQKRTWSYKIFFKKLPLVTCFSLIICLESRQQNFDLISELKTKKLMRR